MATDVASMEEDDDTMPFQALPFQACREHALLVFNHYFSSIAFSGIASFRHYFS